VASPIHLGLTTVNAPDLSIVIVNWNSKDFLEKCLSSVRERGAGLRHEVIVVDNASFDGSAELVERQFPEVRFIQSERNLGFGKANNLAVDRPPRALLEPGYGDRGRRPRGVGGVR
jgi:GT2 family glycosyltransferase